MSAQLDRLNRRMAAIPAAVKLAVVPALEKNSVNLKNTMRLLAPKDTGALADSLAVTLPGETTPAYSQPGGSTIARENQVLVTAGNSDVRYAHLVEHGTAASPAQPYFFPAYRLLKKKMARSIKRAISKAVKEAR